jgi:transforming growth factor-beta-induced protein
MIKLGVLTMYRFLVLVALLVLALPVFAQDEAPTIAEIVVASAEGETPEFTTLLAAVSAADPAILEALSDPEAELTVFAPTDAAFAALAEALGEEAFAAVLADPAMLSDILLYHVVDGAVYSADVVTLLGENEGVLPVVTLNGQFFNVNATLDDMGAVDLEQAITVGEANLVLEMVDIEASNGVIHVIDAVLVPETRTIAEIVVASSEAETPEFTTLLTAVSAADPAVLELLSDPEATLTVFAPTDAAFAALGEETLSAVVADTEMLTNILSYHVLPSVVYSFQIPDLLDDMGTVEIEMADTSPATISVTEEGVFINEAQVVMTDIQASNGVIHVIDAVILPPTE